MPTLSGSLDITGSINTTGSFNISGSINSNGSPVITNAQTGSFITTAGTASYATFAISSSAVNTQGAGSGTWYPLVKSSISTGYFTPSFDSRLSYDYNTNALTVTSSRAAAVPATGSNPASPVTGSLYYNPSTNLLYIYNGTTWRSASFV
jgi:hypothetical protein